MHKKLLILVLLLTLANPSYARDLSGYDLTQLRGWDYLFTRMVEQGFNSDKLFDLFSNSKLPLNEPVYFRVTPREPRAIYRGHTAKSRRVNAINFYNQHKNYFKEAEAYFKVPEEIILAIIQVETNCGINTGRSPVLYRLARLAGVASPENIEKNFKAQTDKKITREQVEARAKELEKIFMPQVMATLLYAAEKKISPFALSGSSAGAIGLPQFLPGNYFLYGVDGDSDGVVDLLTPADAIFSIANFLKEHGWEGNMSTKEKKEVLWHYNRSKPYIDTVMALAKLLKQEMD
jgi:membrane-bound lytic murein transglycosylase B